MSLANASPLPAFVVGIDLQSHDEQALASLGADLHRQLLNDVEGVHHLQPCATGPGRFLLLWVHPCADTAQWDSYWQTLRTLNDRLSQLGLEHPELVTRLLAHHGTVFVQQSAQSQDYVGSALRTVQAELNRAVAKPFRAATAAFASQMQALPATGLQVAEPQREFVAHPLLALQFNPVAVSKPEQTGLGHLNPVDIEYVRKQMTRQMGPFANTLVDTAVRRSRSQQELVINLSLGIDDPRVRTLFVQMLNRYFDTR